MRSWLFVPGAAVNKLEKAAQSAVDAVIVDLEDAVAPAEKGSARAAIQSYMLERRPGAKKYFLRINGRASQWYQEDLAAAVRSGFDGVMLPKSGGWEDICITEELLRSAGVSPENFELLPLVETASGILHAAEMISGSFVRRLTFGSIDFLLDIGGRSTAAGTELLYARSYLALVSGAAGKEGPVDTVFPDFRDDEGLRRDAELAQSIGFTGKLVIHPRQIEVVNRVFSPAPEEITYAQEVKNSFEAAARKGLGAIQLRGKMIDKPVYEKNLRLLEQAKQYALI